MLVGKLGGKHVELVGSAGGDHNTTNPGVQQKEAFRKGRECMQSWLKSVRSACGTALLCESLNRSFASVDQSAACIPKTADNTQAVARGGDLNSLRQQGVLGERVPGATTTDEEVRSQGDNVTACVGNTAKCRCSWGGNTAAMSPQCGLHGSACPA